MNKFITLIKRDLTENKNALIITPIAISLIIIALYFLATISGQISISADNSKFSYFFTNGAIGNLAPEARRDLAMSSVIISATSSIFIILVSMFTVLFVLANSLYEERKDKSIMFWKSLPISDLETVLSKLVSIAFIGIGFATIVSLILHIILLATSILIANKAGLNSIDFNIIFQTFPFIWGLILISIISYIIGALPIYAWFLFMSAKADKAPFWAAMLPIILLPIIAGIVFPKGELKLIAMMPLGEMLGQNIWGAWQFIGEDRAYSISNLDIFKTAEPFIKIIFSPYSLIEIILAGILLWGAAQIRKSKSF